MYYTEGIVYKSPLEHLPFILFVYKYRKYVHMTKEELLQALRDIADLDQESRHVEADELLLEYIDDDDISNLYNSYPKWYA